MSKAKSNTSNTRFSDLNLASTILNSIKKQGYDTPTPIQARAIPPILDGRDVLGCAQTGTGKTAAFALPVLDLLSQSGNGRQRGERLPRALILSPTRELAEQIADSFNTYGKNTKLKHTVIYGGVSQGKQVRSLMQGTDIIVATPGRLQDLMQQGYVNLEAVELFVLDEADRMLDMGFITPIRQIASDIPEDRQTLLFSATMPKSIAALADSLLTDPVKVTVNPIASTAPKINQSLYMVDQSRKPALLSHLLAEHHMPKTLVFTRTKHGADKLTRKLARTGVTAAAIHGNKSQAQRQRALDLFRKGKAQVLVATDVAARGIDVDAVSHVINYNLPEEPESYVHRIGRTGRAGAEGQAIAFCDKQERKHLKLIQKVTGADPTLVDLPDLPRDEPQQAVEGVNRAADKDVRRQDRARPARSSSHPTTGRPARKAGKRVAKAGAKPAEKAARPKRKSKNPGVFNEPSKPGSRRSRAAAAGKTRSTRKARPAGKRGPSRSQASRPGSSKSRATR